jgi:hypothetical protein
MRNKRANCIRKPGRLQQTAALLGLFLLAGNVAAQTRLPSQVDLTTDVKAFGLTPDVQGDRGDCTLFAITTLAEFEWAKHGPRPRLRFSEEFLIWAADEACGTTGDQAMFFKAVHGLNSFGICKHELMPYRKRSDLKRKPSAAALTDAKERSARWKCEWIRRWDVKRPANNQELHAIKEALASGHPVACGLRFPKSLKGYEILDVPPPAEVYDGHSIVFTGFQDNPKTGEGVFAFRNSWGTGWGKDGYGMMTYAYVWAYANDLIWLLLGSPHSEIPVERFEAEALPVSARSRCQTETQDTKDWGWRMWSGGKQHHCIAQEGGFEELSFAVAKAGRYRVRVLTTAAPDFGKVQAKLDGHKPSDFDLYFGVVSPSGSLEMGTYEIAVGRHQLRFAAVGRNPDSTGYKFGIDTIDLLAPAGKE